MKNFFNEFKKFISRGSVLDLAIGVVIGSSFTAIVNSMVNDVIMPVVGVVTGGIDFSSLCIPLYGESVMNIGSFLQNIVNFLIVAFVLFIVVRNVNKIKEKNKEEEPAPAAPVESDEVKLLKEINKNLKKLNK